jgi:hypothetical protein
MYELLTYFSIETKIRIYSILFICNNYALPVCICLQDVLCFLSKAICEKIHIYIIFILVIFGEGCEQRGVEII